MRAAFSSPTLSTNRNFEPAKTYLPLKCIGDPGLIVDLSFNLEAMLMDAAGIPIPIENHPLSQFARKVELRERPMFASVTISDTAALQILS